MVHIRRMIRESEVSSQRFRGIFILDIFEVLIESHVESALSLSYIL